MANKIALAPGQKIWICRSGQTSYKNPTDPEWILTEKGVYQSNEIGKFLYHYGFDSEDTLIISSPAVRAIETIRSFQFSNSREDGLILFDNLYSPEYLKKSLQVIGRYEHDSKKIVNRLKGKRRRPLIDTLFVEAKDEIQMMQKKLMEVLEENDFRNKMNIIIMSHDIIANYVVDLFTSDKQLRNARLAESEGFLLQNFVELHIKMKK